MGKDGKKKIWLAVVILAAVAAVICTVMFWGRTAKAEADFVVPQKGEHSGTLELHYQNKDAIFGFKDVNGTVVLEDTAGDYKEEYSVVGDATVLAQDFYNFNVAGIKNTGSVAEGHLYTDKEMKNMILDMEGTVFVSADQAFIDEINSYANTEYEIYKK